MKLVREHIIFEKFTEDSDPIDDLQIGMKHQIKRWVETETRYKPIEKDLLWICAEAGKTEFVEYLLAKGANVHAENDSALRWASYYGHTDVVKLLLDAGANVHAENDSALRWASHKGHVEIVKLLLDAGADVHAEDDWALRNASENGYVEVVKLLLDVGADVHAEDDWALRWASNNGHVEVVKLLLGLGADVHAENDYALQWASYYGHEKVVKVLKDYIAKEKNKNKIKESLNEKFTEDSDPIKDLSIGLYIDRTFETRKKAFEFISNFLPAILGTDEIPKDILNDPGERGCFISQKYAEKIEKYCNKYLHLYNKNEYIMYWEDFHLFLKKKYPYLISWIIEGEGIYANGKKHR